MKDLMTGIGQFVVLFVVSLLTIKLLAGLVAFTIGFKFADGFFHQPMGVIAVLFSALFAFAALIAIYENK
jgi:hypothetical protein